MHALFVAALLLAAPPPRPARTPPKILTTGDALGALATQVRAAVRSGGLDLVRVNLVSALAHELDRR